MNFLFFFLSKGIFSCENKELINVYYVVWCLLLDIREINYSSV